MLVVTFHNDSTGTEDLGNYDVKVSITVNSYTLKTLWVGRIEGHPRNEGWQGLIKRLSQESEGK